jgi:hypothetical protein
MFYSSYSTDSYNKTVHTNQGTLMSNWQEERVLREDTGVGRTLGNAHINKKHDDLFRKPVGELETVYEQNKTQVPTFDRVFGRKHDPIYTSENRDKYAKKNLYAEPTHGKKYELLEKQFLRSIGQELQEANKAAEDSHNQRYLNTTYENEFVKKNVGLNVIGRRVMRTQDGGSVLPGSRDEDLLVDYNCLKRSPLANEADLQAAVKKTDYVNAQPYTFWAEKAKDKAFYTSQQTNEQAPFTRNNEFLKTFTHYTHKKN